MDHDNVVGRRHSSSPLTATLCAYRDCGRIVQRNGYCPTHAAQDNARRHAKQRTHGRNTRHWRRLRQARLELDGHQCQRCSSSSDLTVHLDPALDGNHAAATIDDVITLCRSCHGTVDAPRAKGGAFY